jgi:hypothetical protein
MNLLHYFFLIARVEQAVGGFGGQISSQTSMPIFVT